MQAPVMAAPSQAMFTEAYGGVALEHSSIVIVRLPHHVPVVALVEPLLPKVPLPMFIQLEPLQKTIV